jgi:hypothetical protein
VRPARKPGIRQKERSRFFSKTKSNGLIASQTLLVDRFAAGILAFLTHKGDGAAVWILGHE